MEHNVVYIGNDRCKLYVGSSRRCVVTESALPYDAEVEYIQADGNAYIDLGFRATDNIAFDMYINRATNNIRFDCGGEEGWNAKIIRLLIQEGNNQVNWRYGNTSTSGNTITATSNCVGDVRIEVNKKVAKITNITTGNTYNKTVTGNTPILTPGNFIIFGVTVGTEAVTNPAFNGAILYSAKVTDTNVNLDLIPVRVGTTGYLYDKVSGTLFGNAGTGDFILGNDKT